MVSRTVQKIHLPIKKESPNEGTETEYFPLNVGRITTEIKKESPNEGTETNLKIPFFTSLSAR